MSKQANNPYEDLETRSLPMPKPCLPNEYFPNVNHYEQEKFDFPSDVRVP